MIAKCQFRSISLGSKRYITYTVSRNFASTSKFCRELKKYSPKEIEPKWSDIWLKKKLYKPKSLESANDEKTFYMLAPPPNVTGVLHLGHAMTAAIQDAYARYYRMKGHSVNWVPGTDHAGISTQVIVEKQIRQKYNKNRHDLGREKFVEHVWEWKNASESRISHQLKKLGASMNWDQEYFTMDEGHSRIVQDAFIKLFNEGLIYRETKLVSWCCALQSVISDIEIDTVELPAPEFLKVPGEKEPILFGAMYFFAYEVQNDSKKSIGEVIVGTTRPETVFGDTAIAVHPLDPRYKEYIGKYAIHPISGERIPIVGDHVCVDMNFGTGAVKITPSHDFNDFECAKRHGLPMVTIFTEDGRISTNIKEFNEVEGLNRWEARRYVIDYMIKKNKFRGSNDNRYARYNTHPEICKIIKEENSKTIISTCSRTGDIIEPMIEPQWFVKATILGKKALELVKNGDIEISPEKYNSHWRRWLENIQDWCISRQLWWGHRVPAYRVSTDGKNNGYWVAAKSSEDALNLAKKRLLPDESIVSISQDEDVLDTWFSSGLLPLTAFNSNEGPENTLAFSKKKKLSDFLETGNDILFFWVARMVMLCYQFTGAVPFEKVFLHPMIRDSSGRKMSKSLGNVIDPLSVVEGITLKELERPIVSSYLSDKEKKAGLSNLRQQFPNGIPEYGADSLRMALVLYSSQSEINININNIKSNYHFANKLWNSFRFIEEHMLRYYEENINGHPNGQLSMSNAYSLPQELSIFDAFIFSRFADAVKRTNSYMKDLRAGTAAECVKNFVLRDFCDSYIDLSKHILFKKDYSSGQTHESVLYSLVNVFSGILKLLHPFMPFITEELFESLKSLKGFDYFFQSSITKDAVLMISEYPEFDHVSKYVNREMESYTQIILEICRASRMLRQTNNVHSSLSIPKLVICVNKAALVSGIGDSNDNGKPSNLSGIQMESGETDGIFSFDISKFERIVAQLSYHIKSLSKSENLELILTDVHPDGYLSIPNYSPQFAAQISSNVFIYVPELPKNVDVATIGKSPAKPISQAEIDKQTSFINKLTQDLEKLIAHTTNKTYILKSPESQKKADMLKISQLKLKIEAINKKYFS